MTRVFASSCFFFLSAFAFGHTIEGVVLQTGNDPATDAEVWLSQDRQVHRTATGPDGRFAFNDVRAGDVEIVARKEGFALGGVMGRVAGSSEVTIDLKEAAEIPLRIIDQTYRPVEGVRLTHLVVSDAFQAPVGDLTDHGFPTIRSDAEGKLVIPNVPKGAFVRFTIDDPRYAQTYVPYFATGHPEQDIIIKDGVVVRGRVTSEDGTAIADARVSLFTNTSSGILEMAEPLTDPEGFFNARVQPGALGVAARHPDYAPADVQPAIIPVQAEQITVDVTMGPPHYVSGRVVNEDGQPVGGVDVAYLRDDVIYTNTLTDVDGRFQMNVGEGEGFVYIFPPEGFMVEGTARYPMDIEKGRKIVMQAATLIPLPVIEGTILDRDNAPVANAVIRTTNLQQPVWALSEADGTFRIAFDTMPYEERIELVAEHPLRFQRRPFTVDPRDPRQGPIKLFDYDPDLAVERKGYGWNDLSELVGKPAPDIVCGEWWNGGPVAANALKDKVVVLTLWGGFATIGPGRVQIDAVNWIHDALDGVDDVQFIAVHDNSLEPADVERYIEEYGITYPVGRDQAPAETFTNYRTTTIPQTVLIGKDGNVRYYDTSGRLLELIKVLRRE